MFRPLLISMFLTSTALADTWTVDDDGKADFDNIQAAVDAASDGDEIVVMPGTYTSTQDGNVLNMLGKAVTLRSSDPSDPDVVAATIIDGEDTRRGIYCGSTGNTNTIIMGLTITNGFASATLGNNGGGILIDNRIALIENCVINNNQSNSSGGGIQLKGSGSTIRNCTIDNNSTLSSNGAGVDCYFSSPNIIDSTITNNYAVRYGGAIACSQGSNVSLFGCNVFDNSAGENGGGLMSYSLAYNLTDTTLCSNMPNNIDTPCSPDCTGYNDGGGNTVSETCPFDCSEDINGDSNVDVSDLLIVIGYWGSTNSPADINQNGIVDVSDLLMVVGNWGPCE